MLEKNETYPLGLHSRKYKFNILTNLNNKKLLIYLVPIRNKFRRVTEVINCKENVEFFIHKIIPNDFFGCTKNKKLFMNLVKKILNHRKTELLHMSLLSRDFENKFKWSTSIEDDDFQKTVTDVNLYLLEKCIKPFITRHFFPVSKLKSYQIDLVPRYKWQSFRDRVFQGMLSKRHVRLGKESTSNEARGALRIIPKESLDCFNYRPVICYFTKSESIEDYKYLCQIKKKIKVYVDEKKLHTDIHKSWEEFVKKSSFKMIYGVKADIRDSFGSINIEKLSWVILHLPERTLQNRDKNFIINRIRKQYVSFNNSKNRTKFQWCHGLLQGDRLSSVLCDLYYLELIDLKLLKKCFIGNYFFHRTVDDYIFCSTSKENVETFIANLKQAQVLNADKIFSNVINEELLELPYCGYIFNLFTKEVYIEFNIKTADMKNKFKLWNDHLFNSPDLYLTSIMKFSSSNFYFSKVILNTHFNNEETIVKIYFQSMIYLGMKFHCAFTEVKQYHKEYSGNAYIVTKKILQIIELYSKKTIKIIEKFKGNLFNGDIKFQMLLSVGVRAFILVFQKYSVLYKDVILALKKQVLMKIKFFGGLDISSFKKIPSNLIVKNLK